MRTILAILLICGTCYAQGSYTLLYDSREAAWTSFVPNYITAIDLREKSREQNPDLYDFTNRFGRVVGPWPCLFDNDARIYFTVRNQSLTNALAQFPSLIAEMESAAAVSLNENTNHRLGKAWGKDKAKLNNAGGTPAKVDACAESISNLWTELLLLRGELGR